MDLNKVALFGTSSGSGLATGLAIRLKDRDVVQPKIVICDRYVRDFKFWRNGVVLTIIRRQLCS